MQIKATAMMSTPAWSGLASPLMIASTMYVPMPGHLKIVSVRTAPPSR